MHPIPSVDVLLIAFDTATPAVSVALVRTSGDGSSPNVLAHRTATDHGRHGEQLAPALSAVLAEAGVSAADLGGVGVGVGPGPFTGLRVGLVTARALSAAVGAPLYGVCTLDVLAAERSAARPPEGDFVVATDARRKEVYWARYRAQACAAGPGADRVDVERLDGPHVDLPAQVPNPGLVVGRGAALYPDVFGAPESPSDPDARTLARLVTHRLAAGGELLDAEPLYLRRPDAAAPGRRKRVTA